MLSALNQNSFLDIPGNSANRYLTSIQNYAFLFPISPYFLLFTYLNLAFKHNKPRKLPLLLKSSFPPHMPVQIKYVVSKIRQKQVDLIGKKTNIPRSFLLKMQRKDTKYSFYLGPDARKNPVPPLLLWRKRPSSANLGQDAAKLAFFAASLPECLLVVGLVGENGRFIPFKQFINHLGVVYIGWCTNKFRHELIFGINGDVILIAIDGLLALFGEGSIVIFSGTSCGLNQSGIYDFSDAKLKALLSELAFELVKTLVVEVHGFKVGSEAGDSGVIRHGVNSRKAEEAAIEKVACEHEFHFGVGVAVDLLDDELSTRHLFDSQIDSSIG